MSRHPTDVVERAKAALEGVTEGPWKPCHAGNVHYGVSDGDYDFPTVVKAQARWDGFGSGSSQADAEFIAAARSLVPELVAEIERLRLRAEPKIEPPDLPEFVSVEARTGTSARWWCNDCDRGGLWSSPREAWDGSYQHVAACHPYRKSVGVES